MSTISTYSTIGNFSTSTLAETVALLAKRISPSTVSFNTDGTASVSVTVNGQTVKAIFSNPSGTVDGLDADFSLIQFRNAGNALTLEISLADLSLNDFKQHTTTATALDLLFLEDDYISGDDGDDVIRGYDGDDNIWGYGGDDFLGGGNDADMLSGGGGNDSLAGGAGLDTLYGEDGKDVLNGESGNDELYGGSGNDLLKGGTGNDWMNGDSGRDTIEGGKGADMMRGGSGRDVFVFKSVTDSTVKEAGRDMISDFSEGSGDKIDLSAIDASTKSGGNQTFKFVGDGGFHKKAGELRFKQYESETYVYGDTNGDGKADFAIGFSGLIDFTKADFIL
ncbi:calcium-binding protein [Shinella sp. 838]|jgi:Ca2+-binding RTX toxin-like protein|uniref:calcium-binding protein n=1 Tax=unclassified Shinella TaxID=2643062 RepID=UPI0003C542D3|nr:MULTISPECIES: calcium-binding protein [unclassified Shinella]EYR83447.1 serralysin C [Shinella sp. DD12]MDG4671056.1 calcium-binding protein [Shinella sp. 838]